MGKANDGPLSPPYAAKQYEDRQFRRVEVITGTVSTEMLPRGHGPAVTRPGAVALPRGKLGGAQHREVAGARDAALADNL